MNRKSNMRHELLEKFSAIADDFYFIVKVVSFHHLVANICFNIVHSIFLLYPFLFISAFVIENIML